MDHYADIKRIIMITMEVFRTHLGKSKTHKYIHVKVTVLQNTSMPPELESDVKIFLNFLTVA